MQISSTVPRLIACLLALAGGPGAWTVHAQEPAAASVPAPRIYNLIDTFGRQNMPELIADFGQPPGPSAQNALAFRQQVRKAVMAHPSLKAGADRWAEAEGARAEVRGALFPQIYAGFGGESTLVERPGVDVPSDMNTNLYVRVTQLLFDAGALFRKVEAAESRVEAQRLGLQVTAQGLALKALNAYYDVENKKK